MKIYIVTCGEYSDYGILAAFLDKSKAESFVEKYNRPDGCYDKAEIEEYEEGIPFDFNSHDIYEVRFYEGTDRVPDVTKTELRFWYQNIPRVVAPGSPYVSGWSHLVTVAAKDKEHAFKIACDTLAKWKAEKEGL